MFSSRNKFIVSWKIDNTNHKYIFYKYKYAISFIKHMDKSLCYNINIKSV